MPTDTVYGIAALPTDRSATDQLFALKGRGENVPIAVLCADAEQALELADASVRESLRAVAERFWPGALTMVVRRAAKVDLHLGEPSDTIGLRVPDHDLVRAIAEAVGPIAATSANRHGDPTPVTATEAAASLVGDVGLVVDGGTLTAVASTVIDATTEPWRVLRAGAVDADAVIAHASRAERGGEP